MGPTVRLASGTSAPVPVAAQQVRNGRWWPVGIRTSGASLYRVETPTGDFYVKATPPREPDDPRFRADDEANRLVWLAGQGIRVPEVVEVGAGDAQTWLVTTALPGVPASSPWTAEQRRRVVDVVADVTRELHGLPIDQCPFDRRLAVTHAQARCAVRLGAVDLDDVDPDRVGWTARDLLDELDRTPAPPEDDLVVCHGDLGVGNILISPDTLELTGILDVGRLGVADRWLDLSIVLSEFGPDCPYGYEQIHAERFLRRYAAAEVNSAKLDYYRLLDEFM